MYGFKMCEKYLGKGRNLYGTFTDFEKGYDRNAMQQLQGYGMGGKLLRVKIRFYKESKPCDKEGE